MSPVSVRLRSAMFFRPDAKASALSRNGPEPSCDSMPSMTFSFCCMFLVSDERLVVVVGELGEKLEIGGLGLVALRVEPAHAVVGQHGLDRAEGEPRERDQQDARRDHLESRGQGERTYPAVGAHDEVARREKPLLDGSEPSPTPAMAIVRRFPPGQSAERRDSCYKKSPAPRPLLPATPRARRKTTILAMLPATS